MTADALGNTTFGWGVTDYAGGRWVGRLVTRTHDALLGVYGPFGYVTPPTSLVNSDDFREDPGSFDLASAADGASAIVWEETQDPYPGGSCCQLIRGRSRSAGGVLGPVRLLSRKGKNSVGPQVAIDDSGTAYFVSTQSDGAHWRATAQVLSADGMLGRRTFVSPPGLYGGGGEVAALPGGGAVIAWSTHNGQPAEYRIQALTVSSSGDYGRVQTVGGPAQIKDGQFDLDVGEAGDVVITWAIDTGWQGGPVQAAFGP